jgi:hypothetical protein
LAWRLKNLGSITLELDYLSYYLVALENGQTYLNARTNKLAPDNFIVSPIRMAKQVDASPNIRDSELHNWVTEYRKYNMYY